MQHVDNCKEFATEAHREGLEYIRKVHKDYRLQVEEEE